jgi:ubiquinol-cytochrome c reductase cytochrome b subunit
MVLTGFLLAQLYNPLPQQAYQSLEKIQQINWASYLRALHYWFAQGVLFALILHTTRVFVTGAYKHPRQVTWWIGVALLGTMLMGSYFTGTVLKWDQEGADALSHFKGILRMLGPIGAMMAEWPGSSPMNLRIYVSHIAVYPVLIVLLVMGHFYLIHIFNLAPTAWGKWSNAPEVPPQEIKGWFSEHARSILLLSVAYYGFLALVAIFVRAPLGEAPSGHGDPVKPPWPFLWMYLFENIWGVGAVLYVTMILFGFLALVPLLDRGQERRLGARKGILSLGALVGLSLIALTIYGWAVPAQEHTGHSHDEEGAVMGEEGDHHEEGDHPHDPAVPEPAPSQMSSPSEKTHLDDHDHPEEADHHDEGDHPPDPAPSKPVASKMSNASKKKPHVDDHDHPDGADDHHD